jgi:hypothetical protein
VHEFRVVEVLEQLAVLLGQAALRWGGTVDPGEDLIQPGAILLWQTDVSRDVTGAVRDQMDVVADPAAGPLVKEPKPSLDMVGLDQDGDRTA